MKAFYIKHAKLHQVKYYSIRSIYVNKHIARLRTLCKQAIYKNFQNAKFKFLLDCGKLPKTKKLFSS